MGEELNTVRVPDSAFKASAEKLEPSDKRDEFIKEITADCAHLRELAWGMRPLANADDDARRDISNGKISVDEFVEIHDRFTAAEDALNNLLESIEHRVHQFNRGKTIQQRIYVSHTEEGLAIRVSNVRKITLWGV